MLFDGDGSRMTPSHAVKKGTRYRYYVSRSPIESGKRNSRPQLQLALAEYRLRRATLVIAKLDRLARIARLDAAAD